jgi:1-deoxy-D-xylulose-5-phosphate reductoisomerase
MRLPIAYGMLYPERVDVGADRVSFGGAVWTFHEPRSDVFRCLPLAVEAGRAGGAYPVALNAANEVAVESFLDRGIDFPRIAGVIEDVLGRVPKNGEMDSMEAIEAVDNWARGEAVRLVAEVAAR